MILQYSYDTFVRDTDVARSFADKLDALFFLALYEELCQADFCEADGHALPSTWRGYLQNLVDITFKAARDLYDAYGLDVVPRPS